MTCMLTNPTAETDTITDPQVVVTSPCPRAGGCTLTGKEFCPDDQRLIDTCPTC